LFEPGQNEARSASTMKPSVTLTPLTSVSSAKGDAADALVILIHSSATTPAKLAPGPLFQMLDGEVEGALSNYLTRVRFVGERAAVRVVPTLGQLKYAEIILVGVGPEPCAPMTLAEGVAIGVRAALASRPKVIHVVEGDANLNAETGTLGLDRHGLAGLGAKLGAYQFERYYGEKQKAHVTLEKVCVVAEKSAQKSLDLGVRIADGVCLARDLVNEPPNELYPETFAARAKAIAKTERLECKVLDEKGLRAAGMNLHLAVGQGSERKPRFVHLTYRPAQVKGTIAFVGKGITFDSGGLCIKPMQGMADMKSDMAGAAAVLGLMSVVRHLGLPIEIHGILGLAENMPDGAAYRPADVIVSLSGKGVEIINTDAEGRLVLADALTYAARLKPDFIVDSATLTGATLISLGPSYSAYFTGHDELSTAMTKASLAAGENFWRMPLVEELAQELKSDVTDLQHTGQRYGGAITAALFLREFVEGRPWIHTDVPGATFRDRASGLHPKGGTGHGVLTFLELAYSHSQKAIVETSRGGATPAAKKSRTAKTQSARPTSAARRGKR
jgi:leucyl aminopeptidase